MSSKTTAAIARQESANYCHICCHESDLFCIGPCEHPICFECGVRMRVICESKECPICRAEIKTMIVVNSENRASYSKYETSRNLVVDSKFKKYGLKFENTAALNAVKDILAHVCTVCEDEPEFRNFNELSHHMRRNHELFYCDLCATNLQLFSWERKCYNREQLAKHRRMGDPDDRSHRGHPLCEFCDERHMDDEHLFRHLRRDHYFCHFCDADGMHKFFPNVDELKKHMKSDHFLCEEGQCKDEPLGISFRNDIDFKAHKANVHGSKQERIVNLNFDIRRGDGPNERDRTFRDRDGGNRNKEKYARPSAGARSAAGGGSRGGGKSDQSFRNGSRKVDGADSDDPDLARAIESSKAASHPFALKTEEFPSLNPNAAGSSATSKGKTSMANYVASAAGLSTKAGSLDENDFPSLPTKSKKGKETQKKKTAGQRARRNSRSASPSNSQTSKSFVVLDDDELFPSISEQIRTQNAAPVVAASESGPSGNAKESQASKKLSAPIWNRATASAAVQSKSKGSAWETAEEAFPALVSSSGGKSKQTKKSSSEIRAKPWSELLGDTSGTTETKKEETKRPNTKKKDVPSPSSMATDALLEALPPGLPVKSKARRVAQLKQRPSECNDDGPAEEEKKSTSVPPPGFENVVPSSVLPPPGFENPVDPNGTVMQLNGAPNVLSLINEAGSKQDCEYQYKKPSNFDVRNRALFDRLRALMNNDEMSLQEFKKASSEYRRGEISAIDYCDRVRRLLNDDGAYVRVFSELVCLLPDIQRQHDLWDAFRSGKISVGGGFGPSNVDAVKPCSKCGQLLVKIDYYEHAQNAHPMKGVGKSKNTEEYPALS